MVRASIAVIENFLIKKVYKTVLVLKLRAPSCVSV